MVVRFLQVGLSAEAAYCLVDCGLDLVGAASIIGVDAVKDFLELITELVDPYAELNVHGERVYTPVADVLHGRKCAATEGNCVGEMVGKILKRRVRIAREVVRNALCNLADREIVALRSRKAPNESDQVYRSA